MHTPAHSGTASVLDGLARLILITSTALLPVFIMPFQWVALPQSKMLFLAGALALAALFWMGARLFDGVIHVPRGVLLFAVLLLPAAYIASAAATGFATHSVLGAGVEQDTLAAVVLWFAAFVLAAFLFSGHAAGIRVAVRAFSVGLCALFVFQIAYVLFPAVFSFGGFLQGSTANLLGSWHDLGILAGLTLASVVILFRSTIFAGVWRFFAIALGVASVGILVLVHFTDVLWGAAALMALTWLVAMWTDMRGGRALYGALIQSIVPLILAVVLSLAAVFGTSLWDKLPARFLITDVEVRPSWQGTFDVGRQSLDAPSQVLFGTGPNSFVRAWGQHKPEGVNLTPFWNADFSYGIGIIPTSVFTAGLVGLIAWGAIVVVLLALGWRFIREPRPLFGFLLLGSLYLVVFHMLYTPGIAVTALTFILMGFLAAVAAGERATRALEPRSVGGSVAFAAVVLCAVPIVASAGLIGREIVSNLNVNRAATLYQASGNVTEASAALEKALMISPRNDRAHRAAAELGLVQFSQLAAQGEPQTAEARTALQNTLQATIQHGLTAVEIDGDNYQNWLLLAQVYGSLAGVNIEGASEEAKRTYEQAFAANPTNPLPKLRLAQLAASRNDLAGARTYLDEALALKQDFAAAYFLRSQIEAAEGKLDVATEAASAAVQLVPQDPLGWFNLGQILFAAGDYTNAAAVLEQAVLRANDYSNALFYLSASYYRLGRTPEAIAALERVAALNPNEAAVKDAVVQLREGKNPFTQ